MINIIIHHHYKKKFIKYINNITCDSIYLIQKNIEYNNIYSNDYLIGDILLMEINFGFKAFYKITKIHQSIYEDDKHYSMKLHHIEQIKY